MVPSTYSLHCRSVARDSSALAATLCLENTGEKKRAKTRNKTDIIRSVYNLFKNYFISTFRAQDVFASAEGECILKHSLRPQTAARVHFSPVALPSPAGTAETLPAWSLSRRLHQNLLAQDARVALRLARLAAAAVHDSLGISDGRACAREIEFVVCACAIKVT